MNGDLANLTDGELVSRARRGYKEAFETLIERHQATALRAASRLSPDRGMAQELVQEALLEAYLSLDRLRDPERFKSWLIGILLNMGRNRLRRQLRDWTAAEEIAFDEETVYHSADSLPDPQQIAEERDLHRIVLAAIDDLHPGNREAILLYYFEYLSIEEIAVILGVPVNTVKVRLHRARHSLRQALETRYPEFRTLIPEVPRRKTMVKVTIADVIKHKDKTVVFLMSEAGERVLPIWIGEFEGASIVVGALGFQTQRPLTFNFMASVLNATGATLEEVRVEALKDNTFYGVAKIKVGDKLVEVDARPSDVLALALRTGSPVYVAEEVMAQAGKSISQDVAMPEDLEVAAEMPLPTGSGMETILEELKASIFSSWKPCE